MRPTSIAIVVLIGAFVATTASAYPPDPCRRLHGTRLEYCRDHSRKEHTAHRGYANEGWEQDHHQR